MSNIASGTRHYQHLVMLNVLFVVLCIPTAGKTVDILGSPLSVTIFYFPFVFIIADLLTEVYGYALARRAAWYSVIAQLIAVSIFQFAVSFPPSETLKDSQAFVIVLGQAPVFVVVGTIALFSGDIVNNFVLSKMKILSNGANMSLRFVVSTVAGEAINTFIFYFFALVLTGIIPLSHALGSIVAGTVAKVIVEIAGLPLAIWAAKRLKKIEGIDHYDSGTNFNPLIF